MSRDIIEAELADLIRESLDSLNGARRVELIQ